MGVTRQSTTGKRSLLEEDNEALENQLFSYLGQVQPHPEFVQKLKYRLTQEPSVTLERRSRMAAFVVAAMGLFFGALLVWIMMGIRSLFFRETTNPISN